MAEYFGRSSSEGSPVKLDEDEIRKFLSDKLVALERDKAEFCSMLCRAVNPKRIVEVGTSHGVSTLYSQPGDQAAANTVLKAKSVSLTGLARVLPFWSTMVMASPDVSDRGPLVVYALISSK
jgi:hypothetical protein